MQKTLIASRAALALLAIAAMLQTAYAQTPATRTWVSGTGDDSAACSRTAPCLTFSGALSKTAVNGEINCINAGDYGPVFISQSVTIDCTAVPSTVAANAAITIGFAGFASSDTQKTVNIRGLTLQGAGNGYFGISIGGEGTGSHVYIQNVTINGDFGTAIPDAAGLVDVRTNGNLVVQNVTIRNMALGGISIKPNGGTGIIRATLDKVTVANAASGLTSSAGAAMTIRNSVFTQNSVVGVQVGPAAQALIERTRISHNGVGLSGAGLIRMSGSSIFLNANAAVSGTVQSYSDNKFIGSIGGTVTPIGSVSVASGRQ